MDLINQQILMYQQMDQMGLSRTFRGQQMQTELARSIGALQQQLARMLAAERLAASQELTARRLGYTTGNTKAAAENRAERDARRARQAARLPPGTPGSTQHGPPASAAGSNATMSPATPSPGPAGPQMPPGMTSTMFGPMIGGMTTTPTPPSDPYLEALYRGEITPEEYRLLVGEG